MLEKFKVNQAVSQRAIVRATDLRVQKTWIFGSNRCHKILVRSAHFNKKEASWLAVFYGVLISDCDVFVIHYLCMLKQCVRSYCN